MTLMEHREAHRNFIKANFTVLAETEHSIFFEAYGDRVAEICGASFDCETLEEFYDLVDEYEEFYHMVDTF